MSNFRFPFSNINKESIESNTDHINQYSSIKDLTSLIQEYPYVALYRAMLAKKCKDQKHDDFQQTLKNAALYSPDRKRLYHFLNVEVPMESAQDLNVEQVNAETKSIEKKSKNSRKKEQVKQKPDHAIQEEEKIIVPPTKKDEKPIELKKEETKDVSLPQESNEEHTFVEWLAFLDNEVSVNHERNELDEEIKRQEASVKYEAELNDQINELSDQNESSTTDLSDEEHATVNQLAEGSIQLTTGLVTETLAKIMLMQGKINDAIAMYKALSLKYPEKSNYFAAQIEKIKNS